MPPCPIRVRIWYRAPIKDECSAVSTRTCALRGGGRGVVGIARDAAGTPRAVVGIRGGRGGGAVGFTGRGGDGATGSARATDSEVRAGDSTRGSTWTSLASSWVSTSGSRGKSEVTSVVGDRRRREVGVNAGIPSSESGGGGSGKIGGRLPEGLR